MASLKEIKRKIKSVNNTQKTTKAMKLVSSAKLRKTKEVARRSKLYAQKIVEVLADISLSLSKTINQDQSSIFFQERELKVVDIVFITADKGLCGGFNIKTIKAVLQLIDEYKAKNVHVRLRAIGKTGIEFFNFQGIELYEKHYGLSSSPDYTKACDFIEKVIDEYQKGLSDKVIIVHNGYKNMITQELRVENLVPVSPLELENMEDFTSVLDSEPEGDELLNELLKTYFEYNMYFALIDSLAAEHSARVQAMDNASENAKEMVKSLNLAYNKARQESITTELIEIISGVESMK